MNRRLLAVLAILGAMLSAPTLAQDEEVEDSVPAPPAGPPLVSGRTEAVGFVTRQGAVFELQQGARLVIPPELPVGTSRRTVFAFSRARPQSAYVAAGFRPYGPVMSFDGAIDARQDPVVVSIRAPRSPARPNERLVLAMEQATMCNAENDQPLPTGVAGLCSGWALVDAAHEDARLVARMPTPGGYRLVFGSVPAPAPSSPD